jgi:release factor glutamine methyltransferase
MTTKQIHSLFFDELDSFYSKNELAAIWKHCLDFFLKMDPIVFITNPEDAIDDEKVFKIKEVILRLKNYEPIQYISGKAWFCDSIFTVNPSVLIPRPETEELVEEVCNAISEGPVNVMDIGTGSGCIAISIKKKKPMCNLVAIDISEDALDTATNNAVQILGETSVSFINRDVLKRDFADIFKVKFDIIVSNPPYIPIAEKDTLNENVLNFEPHLALFCENEPLLFYKAIANHAKQLLKTDGLLFFEIHENFALEVQQMLEGENFSEIKILDDFHEKARIVKAKINL